MNVNNENTKRLRKTPPTNKTPNRLSLSIASRSIKEDELETKSTPKSKQMVSIIKEVFKH